ncbi:hypothetical protein B0H14DRAFT_2623256 [Mycena olivaceomarginata]|nr:hypothetical protein B0H14DRAFT_2623256 [Mycena olivaceomarginata]
MTSLVVNIHHTVDGVCRYSIQLDNTRGMGKAQVWKGFMSRQWCQTIWSEHLKQQNGIPLAKIQFRATEDFLEAASRERESTEWLAAECHQGGHDEGSLRPVPNGSRNHSQKKDDTPREEGPAVGGGVMRPTVVLAHPDSGDDNEQLQNDKKKWRAPGNYAGDAQSLGRSDHLSEDCPNYVKGLLGDLSYMSVNPPKPTSAGQIAPSSALAYYQHPAASPLTSQGNSYLGLVNVPPHMSAG